MREMAGTREKRPAHERNGRLMFVMFVLRWLMLVLMFVLSGAGGGATVQDHEPREDAVDVRQAHLPDAGRGGRAALLHPVPLPAPCVAYTVVLRIRG